MATVFFSEALLSVCSCISILVLVLTALSRPLYVWFCHSLRLSCSSYYVLW